LIYPSDPENDAEIDPDREPLKTDPLLNEALNVEPRYMDALKEDPEEKYAICN